MKKIYSSPVVDTAVLACSPLLDGPGGGSMFSGTKTDAGGGWPAPKPRPDKPF